jgi:hypothetical protein
MVVMLRTDADLVRRVLGEVGPPALLVGGVHGHGLVGGARQQERRPLAVVRGQGQGQVQVQAEAQVLRGR